MSSDSFDSADPLYSLNRHYPVGKLGMTKANGDVCAGTAIIDSLGLGNYSIKGSVRTGPGTNTVFVGSFGVGTVGDRLWVEGGSQGIQPGHRFTNFNSSFPQVSIPSANWEACAATNFVYEGCTYAFLISSPGYFAFNSLNDPLLIDAPSNAIVNILVYGDVNLTGIEVITITATGARVRMFMGGSSFSLTGAACIRNLSGIAENFVLYGLSTCTNIFFGGNADFTGVIYAPAARFIIGGGGADTYDFVGTCLARTVQMNEHYNFHFDENLERIGVFPARIIAQPLDQHVLAGSNALFQVAADWAVGYQWRFGGTELPGQTNAILSLTNVTPASAGSYSALLWNDSGSVTSAVATLKVYQSPAGVVSARSTADGLELFSDGVPGMLYRIEASTNLIDWLPFTNGLSPFRFADPEPPTSRQKYYRSVWLAPTQ